MTLGHTAREEPALRRSTLSPGGRSAEPARKRGPAPLRSGTAAGSGGLSPLLSPRVLRASLLRAASLAASVILSLGCALFDMSALVVTSFRPQESSLREVHDLAPELRFSKEVNKRSVEEAFSITADGAPLPGRITWPDGRTLRFLPAEPLAPFVVYEMHLSTSAEDSMGNDLRAPFSHTFTTRSDRSGPVVASASPRDRSRIEDPLAPISITFSEAMDPSSLYPAFSLAPPTSGILALSDDQRTLTFTPSEQLRWQTEYLVTVASGASDLQRNPLDADYCLRFTVGVDTSPPTILSVKSEEGGLILPPDDPAGVAPRIVEGWEATSGLIVTFSEPVLTTSATASSRLSPPVGCSIEEAPAAATATLTYRFPDRLAYGTLYTLTIEAGVLDTEGNPMPEPQSYHFLVNGPLSRPPEILRVLFPTSPALPSTSQPLEAWGELDLSNFTVGERTDTFFDLAFAIASGASLDPFTLFESLGFASTNDAAEIVPFAVQIDPSGPSSGPLPATTTHEVVARAWVHLTNNPGSGQMTLRVAPSLADSRGARLGQEFVLPLNEPR